MVHPCIAINDYLFRRPQIIGYEIPAFLAVLAFSLNSGAYMSEVIRAGIQAVDKGQTEAKNGFRDTVRKMMRNIIFPQALKIYYQRL